MTETLPRRNSQPAKGVRLSKGARRAVLLAAAQDVFAANGYHATAMDEIAERAGVSKPVLYQHFPGKLELYLALVQSHVNDLVRLVRAAIESTSDNKHRVHRAMGAYFDFVEREGQAFRLVFESDMRSEPAVLEVIERANSACADPIAEVIRHDTGLDERQAQLLAVSWVGLSQMAARSWLSTNPRLPKEDAVEILSTFAWRGFAGFPLAHHDES
jgi:AcrR family transcriptional regulator